MKPLSDAEEKNVLDSFRKTPKRELKAEIKHLESVKKSTLNNNPDVDVSDLDYYIALRQKGLIR